MRKGLETNETQTVNNRSGGHHGECNLQGAAKDGRYDIIGADIQADDTQGIVQMDIVDETRLAELTQGVDTVLHFAWIKDDGDFLGKVLEGNVSGAYKLFEAAAQNGVRRMIFASSIMRPVITRFSKGRA